MAARACFKRVTNTGVLSVNPTAVPGAPGPLRIGVDDRAPSTVITAVRVTRYGRTIVRGTAVDDGWVRRVIVNGTETRSLTEDLLEWKAVLDLTPGGPPATIISRAEDADGHVEAQPHVVGGP